MTQKNFIKTAKIVTICSAILLFALVALLVFEYARIGSLSKTREQKEAELSELYEERKTLEEGIENRQSLTYAEQYARENLGMLKDGEVIYQY